jgi:hypothetical protein
MAQRRSDLQGIPWPIERCPGLNEGAEHIRHNVEVLTAANGALIASFRPRRDKWSSETVTASSGTHHGSQHQGTSEE